MNPEHLNWLEASLLLLQRIHNVFASFIAETVRPFEPQLAPQHSPHNLIRSTREFTWLSASCGVSYDGGCDSNTTSSFTSGVSRFQGHWPNLKIPCLVREKGKKHLTRC